MAKSSTHTAKRKAKTTSRDLSDAEKQQLELGKMLQAMFEMGYVNKKMTVGMSFVKGVASGFGAVVGATIVVALVLWFLSQFNQYPFIDKIQRTLQSGTSVQIDATKNSSQ